MTGSKIGPYEILEPLGSGGMGEVYRARDTKLNRDVAIKLVPEEFTADEQRMARFQREAQLLAALNHPNIASIYGIEEAGSQNALILELVEGDTLGERLARSRLDPKDALRLAIQIAEALESAHAAGIIHRDLKPANVKVTADDKVKVLDFGLAKALEGDAQEGDDASASPTLSLAATRAGMILGTAGYMSPEQARGQPCDQRADVWAFGVILYEMLAGRQAFSADTVPDTLARVLTQEPAWEHIDTLPEPIRRLLRRCLNKDLKRRFRDIGDVRIEIEDLLEEWDKPAAAAADPEASVAAAEQAAEVDDVAASGVVAAAEASAKSPSAERGVSLAVTAVIAVAALALGAVAMQMFGGPPPVDPPPRTTFSILYPEGYRLATSTHPVAFSPDGRNVVHLMIRGGDRYFQMRPLDLLEGRPLRDAAAVQGHPFFSPDGRYFAFDSQEGALKKVSLAGEPPATITRLPQAFRGGTWLDDDTIVYSMGGDLYRVASAGGESQPIPNPDGSELIAPGALPGSTAVLAAHVDGGERSIVVVSLDSGAVSALNLQGTSPRYAPTGHLVFGRDAFLFAVRFDPATHTISGDPVPVQEAVHIGNTELAHYAFSATGSLAYVPSSGVGGGAAARLVWRGAEGSAEGLPVDAANFRWPRLSPDGSRMAVQVGGSEDASIYLVDVARGGAPRRLTTEGNGAFPVWSADGESVFFSSDRPGADGLDIYRKRADSSEAAVLVLTREGSQWVTDAATDGERLIVEETAGAVSDLYILTLGDDPAMEPAVVTEFYEAEGRFSPDGRFVAFAANDTGQREIYILDLQTGAREIASTAGGFAPLWAPDGSWLAFADGASEWAVDVTTDPRLSLSTARELYARPFEAPARDVDQGGERFLAVSRGGDVDETAAAPRINIVLNWFDKLNELLPSER